MTFLIVLAGLIAFLYLGMPMFAGMAVFSAVILWFAKGDLGTVGEFVFGQVNAYLLVAIPLFMLMAQFMVRGRVVDDLYATAHTLVRHLPGGLAVATVGACAIFAAISGSSVATALTVGSIAVPQMLKYGYHPRTVYGVVAAGGTLGILIPPSTPMVLYAFVAETSIGGLFMAGVFPGLLLATMFAGYAVAVEWRRERASGRERPPRATLGEIGAALRKSFWALTLPPFVLGGMYFGIFTATEAAATGALYALFIAVVVYRSLTLEGVWECVMEATKTSAMLFLIIIGAAMFGHMLTILRIPNEMLELVARNDISPLVFLFAAMALLFLLGLVLESFAIILITTPVLIPILEHLAINKVWYGILLTINLEMALISPPVALNLLVIKAITKAPMEEINRAAMPYMAIMAIATAILILVPELALWLPRQMSLGQ